MKPISKIVFGFSDAENYRRRENKVLFEKIFLRTDELEKLCGRNIFFLVGEKGTGKTAYAVYLANNVYKNNVSLHRFVRETDYQKFMALKKANNLSLSDYTSIWKVIIYLLLSDAIYKSAGNAEFFIRFTKFKALRNAIDEYYQKAFSPEILEALRFVEDTKHAAELVAKYQQIELKGGRDKSWQKESKSERFQTNLLYLEKQFEEALSSIKLSNSHMLFIDGIDIRPSSIPYADYLECVKGLANASWSVNNDFFPRIRDSSGRLRVVLLVRPDIFNSLGLQNRNTKLRDNSVVLDWRTTYAKHRSSDLFRLADRMFSAQQEDGDLPVGAAWDHYFPFNAATVYREQTNFTSFIVFLRYSFYRPRDILTILDTLRSVNLRGKEEYVFSYGDLFDPDFRRSYGDYVLGELRDSLSFYYDESEFELFLKFFEYLEGAKKFTYEEYLKAYASFSTAVKKQGKPPPEFMKSEEEFLQFLYDLNVICFIERAEDENFIKWCFQERSPTNISPKVKTDVEYEIHYALANVLNTGKRFVQKKAKAEEPSVAAALGRGRIKWFNEKKGFGFIVQPDLPVDIFFHKSEVSKSLTLNAGDAVQYDLEKDRIGRLIAKRITIANNND